ncbi:unnamed protein product [Dibothriocephalus latus]|uniref:Uncharacterized protein n=1 Tax=Dibothriocephalus latus TaxID=60516 RepID=A0A3P7NDH2_DIBLA|nr:unnamed protein product [Dibothriocephalus latus]
MSEGKPAETIIANEPPSSSASSVASEDGTYDFPSEYSNHGQYYICPNHNTPPPPIQLEETGRIPDKRVLSTPGFDCTGGLPEYPRRLSKASSHHRHHHHQHPGLMQATCSYSPQEFFPKRSRSRQPLTPGPPSRKGDERSTASQRSGTGSRAHTPSVGHQAAQESYSPEECTCDYFLYMRGAEGEVGGERQSTIKNVNIGQECPPGKIALTDSAAKEARQTHFQEHETSLSSRGQGSQETALSLVPASPPRSPSPPHSPQRFIFLASTQK